MKRKLFTLLVALIASAGTINAKKVVFDFTNPESLGITAPEAGKGTPLNDSIIIVNGVTMTNKKVHPTDAQIWNASGEYSFRTYKTSTLTFKADDYISAIEFDGSSVLFNEIEFGKVWVGNTDSITFTATGRCIISKITLTVGEPANAWIPDTVTVAQARALIEANDTLDHFVKGIVASQPFNTYDAFSGRVNFYMVDDLAATDSLLACQVHAGQQLNASLLKLVGWASLEAAWEELRIGDTILVYANALNLNATNIYQIESGFYDSKLGANPNPPAIEYPVYDTITVAEAMEIGKALADNAETTEEYVVYGYAGTAYEPKEGYKDQTWYMADEPDVYSEFQAYRCTPDTLVVKGDFMYVKGKLQKYVKDTKVTIEICYGTAVHGEAPAPVELEPITVAQALEIAQALTPEKGKSKKTTEKYAVLGYVVSISQIYENTYYIADEVGVKGDFQAFRCASIDREVAEGDRVIVSGYILHYFGEGSSGEYHNYEISGGTLVHAINTSDPQVDGIWYNFDDSNNTASVTYKGGSYSSYSNEYSGSITIPASIYYNDKTYRITSIGYGAFKDCTGLTSIEIPNSVTSIGEYSFYNCIGLTSVTIPNSVTRIGNDAFYGCTGLTSVSIPDSVTSIGNYAFYGCTGLTSVTIPNSVTSIGGSAFYGCTGLTTVILDSDAIVSMVRSMYLTLNNFFGSQVTEYIIGDNVTSIGSYAFYDCTDLISVTIPNSITSIGNYAFYFCTGLTSVSIPNSVTSIGNYAFYGCSSLTSVTIGNSVTNIREYSFYNCTRLTSVIIPNSVTSIGQSAFNGCTNLSSVTIGNSVSSIEDNAFSGCSGLTSVILNSDAIVRSNYTESFSFKNIFGSQVTEYIIGDNVTSIGEYSFYNCIGLTSVTIPNNVTSIGGSAFYGCNLHDIVLGSSLKSIGTAVFGANKNITTITCYSMRPPNVVTAGNSSFPNDMPYSTIVYVPAEYINAYIMHEFWGNFDVRPIEEEQPQTNMYSLTFLNKDGDDIEHSELTITVPIAPKVDGFTFLRWEILGGNLEDGFKIQAIYETSNPTYAPVVYTNPSNPTQKLIREGNVYILRGDKTYTITGQEVR